MNEATNESAGLRDELGRRAGLAKRAVDDHADLVGERGGVLEVVRHEQDGDLEPGEQLVQLGADRRLRVRVERGERLVEQQHLRVARERARERDALALAAGELARARGREVRDPEALEVLVGRVPPAYSMFCAHGQVREERVVLEDETRPAGARAAGAMPRSASNQTSSSTAIRPGLRASTSPATARSTVVLPAPDGPTSASVEPTSRLSSSSKDRRGTVTWSRMSVAM